MSETVVDGFGMYVEILFSFLHIPTWDTGFTLFATQFFFFK